MAERKPRERIWTRPFVLLTLGNMMYTFGFYMLIQTIPLFVTAKGGTQVEVGVVASSFTISAILLRIFSPFLLSKLTKKNLLRIALVISVLVIGSCGFAPAYGAIIAFRVVQGFGFGMVSTVMGTLAADLLPDSRRGEGIGYFGMGTTLMVMLAPGVGLILSKYMGFDRIFLIAAIGPLLSLVFLQIFSPPEELNRPVPIKTAGGSAIRSVLKNIYDPKLALLTTMMLFFGISRSMEQTFLTLSAKAQGIDVALIAIYPFFQAAVSFVAKYFTGILFDKRGHAWAIIPGGALYLTALVLMSFSRDIWTLLAAGFFSGAGMGALLPGMQSWFVTSVEQNRRSVATASYYNFYDAGQTIGAPALGGVVSALGYLPTFRIAAVPMAVFLGIYLLFRPRKSGGTA